MAFTSNFSINRLVVGGLMGEYLPWKRKYVFLRQHSRSVTICGMDMLILCESSGSCCSFCFTMLVEGSMGTEVKSALTS